MLISETSHPVESTIADRRQSAPRVSAVVLSYNRCEETLTCLASLARQSCPNLEPVVLDNGSKDDSVAAIRREFPEFRLICMPRNYGDWEGRDIAARNCDGDYLMMVDNDAVMEPDTIEKLVGVMESDSRIGVVQARVVDPDTGLPEGMGRYPDRVNVSHYRATFLGGAALIRTEAFRRAGGFPHYLLGGGELFLSLRMLDMGYRIFHYSGTTIFHKPSVHERIPHQRFYLGAKQRIRAIMSHYPGVGRPLSELAWKLASYTLSAVRRRHALRLAWDLPRLAGWGLKDWRGPWIIRNDTVALFDYLTANFVTSAADYDAIAVDRGYLRSRIGSRLSADAGASAAR